MLKKLFGIFSLGFMVCTFTVEAMSNITLSVNHHLFYLEVPESIKEYHQGLMYRRSLAPGHGMIFLFKLNAKTSPIMWMKNTYIPLDMLFIDSDYKIACIKQHTQPLSLEPLGCNEPILAVIELNAGEVGKFHIEKGMELKGN